MNTRKNTLNFSVGVPHIAHKIAQDFCRRLPDSSKNKQIYLNTLSVYTVYQYLKYLDISSNLEQSYSWNTGLQYLSDVADLYIPGYGRLECRPILPTEDSWYIPREIWAASQQSDSSKRLGYIAVKLDESLMEANLLGFLSSVQTSSIPIESLQPVAILLEQLSEPRFHLTKWLKGVIEAGWQVIDPSFFLKNIASGSLGDMPLGYARGANRISLPQVVRQKYLSWKDLSHGTPLNLTVGLSPTDTSEIDIWVEINSQESNTPLPLDLALKIIDVDERTIIQMNSRGTEGIQLKFGAQPNEIFRITVSSKEQEIVETFMV